VATIFTTTLFIATASLALWIDVRAPSLAPSGLKWRALFAIVMLEICGLVPIGSASYVGLYGTVFGVLVPLLVAMWLSALWLLRAAADALASRY
jgi:hypothetical protein